MYKSHLRLTVTVIRQLAGDKALARAVRRELIMASWNGCRRDRGIDCMSRKPPGRLREALEEAGHCARSLALHWRSR